MYTNSYFHSFENIRMDIGVAQIANAWKWCPYLHGGLLVVTVVEGRCWTFQYTRRQLIARVNIVVSIYCCCNRFGVRWRSSGSRTNNFLSARIGSTLWPYTAAKNWIYICTTCIFSNLSKLSIDIHLLRMCWSHTTHRVRIYRIRNWHIDNDTLSDTIRPFIVHCNYRSRYRSDYLSYDWMNIWLCWRWWKGALAFEYPHLQQTQISKPSSHIHVARKCFEYFCVFFRCQSTLYHINPFIDVSHNTKLGNSVNSTLTECRTIVPVTSGRITYQFGQRRIYYGVKVILSAVLCCECISILESFQFLQKISAISKQPQLSRTDLPWKMVSDKCTVKSII